MSQKIWLLNDSNDVTITVSNSFLHLVRIAYDQIIKNKKRPMFKKSVQDGSIIVYCDGVFYSQYEICLPAFDDQNYKIDYELRKRLRKNING